MEIENSKPVSQKNVVYDLSFLNELMQSDKKPSRIAAVQQIPETKPKPVPEKVNPPAKKKKIKTESDHSDKVQTASTDYNDDLEVEAEYTPDHGFKKGKHVKMERKSIAKMADDFEDIIIYFLEKLEFNKFFDDKETSFMEIEKNIEILQSWTADLNVKALLESTLLKKLNLLRDLLSEHRPLKPAIFQYYANKIGKIIEDYTNQIISQAFKYDDIKKQYKDHIMLNKSKYNGFYGEEEKLGKFKLNSIVNREKTMKELKDFIINKNLINQSLAEPFAKNIEDKIYEKSKTIEDYQKNFQKIERIINGSHVCVSDLAQLDNYFVEETR